VYNVKYNIHNSDHYYHSPRMGAYNTCRKILTLNPTNKTKAQPNPNINDDDC